MLYKINNIPSTATGIESNELALERNKSTIEKSKNKTDAPISIFLKIGGFMIV
jgi:hypothetical protein